MISDLITAHQKKQDIRRDVRLTALTGPVRIGLPIIAYLFLYPTIIQYSGLSVLGLWSLIATLSSYINLANVGFSSLFIRSVGSASSNTDLYVVKREHTSATRFYIFITSILLTTWLLVSKYIVSSLVDPEVYQPTALIAAVSIYICGISLAIIAQLDSAILCGAHKTYKVLIIDTFSPLLLYSIALFGASIAKPLEGFAIGTVLSSSFQFFSYKFSLKNDLPDWSIQRVTLSHFDAVTTCVALMKRGFNFYMISIGFILREPLFRAIIVSALGLPAVGIYEIASRVPATIREFIVVGTRSLFPALSHYYNRGLLTELRDLIRQVLFVSMTFGLMALLTYAVCATAIFNLWLPVTSSELVPATRIAALFWAITILNIPFWYLLQSSGYERTAANSILLHTTAIMLLFPLSKLISFTLNEMLFYWVLTSLLTQIAIFRAAESSTGSVKSTLFSRAGLNIVLRIILSSTFLIVVSNFIPPSFSVLMTLVILLSSAILIFILLLLPAILPLLKSMLTLRYGN